MSEWGCVQNQLTLWITFPMTMSPTFKGSKRVTRSSYLSVPRMRSGTLVYGFEKGLLVVVDDQIMRLVSTLQT